MCRYKFGDGKCSYPKNIALECVGENSCQYMNDPIDDSTGLDKVEKDEDMSDNSGSRERCPNTKTGVYCKKYGYFHCSGEENCQEREDYMEHLEVHQSKAQNIDIKKEKK